MMSANSRFFESSDYDLDIDERKSKYANCVRVLCRECNQEFRPENHCKNCYVNKSEEEKYRMLYGRCEGCFRAIKIRNWCIPCNSNRFQQNFNKWDSNNKEVNELIRDSQTSAYSKHILEWIPYERFKEIKHLAKGGFAKVYKATWTDGRIEKWDQESNDWKRSGSFEVALKVLNNSKNVSEDFLSELRFLKTFPSSYYNCIIECYGITQEPKSLNYALVLKLKERNLRTYLDDNYSSLTLKDKLYIIERICVGLDCIHSHDIIHRDLHSGNILHSSCNRRSEISDISISDFGFNKPADEVPSKSKEKKMYGVVPYMAPEILRGKEYTKASDIYSFGVVINEIIFGNRPFNSRSYDQNLLIDICEGLRPNIRNETPEPIKNLIQKCWDQDPEKRPDTNQIVGVLYDFMYTKNERGSYNFKRYTTEYERLKEVSYDMINELTISIDSSSKSYSSKLIYPICSCNTWYVITESSKFQENVADDECLECVIDSGPLTYKFLNVPNSPEFVLKSSIIWKEIIHSDDIRSKKNKCHLTVKYM